MSLNVRYSLIPFKPGFSVRTMSYPPGTPPEELALDEALLHEVESTPDRGILRFWEPSDHFVVLGYTGRAEKEVHLSLCRARAIAVYRRCTGGGTVLQGPGCLNFSLILPYEALPEFESAGGVNRVVMEQHAEILSHATGLPVDIRGVSDLAVGSRKFSGNAQRRGKNAFLFHGTFLLGFALDLVDLLLPMPGRAPLYRKGRTHLQFLMNLPLSPGEVRDLIRKGWSAPEPVVGLPPKEASELARGRYSDHSWIMK
jgi:lipoate-protein ligase A